MSVDLARVAEALPAYEVGEEIGRGACGVVVAGRHRRLGREVAIKLLANAAGPESEVRARFVAEAQMLASLDHPHIVPIYDYVEHEGLCLLVMERLTGGTVADRARGGRLGPQAACTVLVGTCAGLGYAHRKGVLHRDVKPANLMFSSDGILKVADFGIAKLMSGSASPATKTGLVLGTPAYIAPEQAEGLPLTPATDVYAAGLVLYELLSGGSPFPTVDNPLAALYQRVHQPPRSLGEAAQDLPQPLVAIVDRALAQSARDRYADAEVFGRAIDAAARTAWGPDWVSQSEMRPNASTVTAGAQQDNTQSAAGEDVKHAVAAALKARDFPRAMELLRAYLVDANDPELSLLLGQLGMVWGEWDEAREHFELALRLFTDTGMPRRAAYAASWLGHLYVDGIGNRVAGRAWYARAEQMLEGHRPCLEEGYAALGWVGCFVENADSLMDKARLALDRARMFADPSLEARALADGGLGLIQLGRVQDGIAWLDESMALVTGGVVDGMEAGKIYCNLLTASERCGDLARVEAWMQVLRDHGMLGTEGVGALLSSHCYAAGGAVLCEMGRWNEAEAMLDLAVKTSKRIPFGTRLHCLAALANLRIRQGRLDEAEQLLLGLDDRVEAILPLARLHLARGEHELAAAVAGRGLRLVGPDRVRGAPLLEIVVEAALAIGDMGRAEDAARQLRELAADGELPAVSATAAFAHARVAAASGDGETAIATLQDAICALADDQAPLLKATLHLELARQHGLRDRAAAVVEARAAMAIHARLDAPLQPPSAELLERLGIRFASVSVEPPSEAPATGHTLAVLTRDGEYWSADHASHVVRLRDTKGLNYLADLIAHPGVQRHAFDLVDLVEGAPLEPGLDRRRLGDAGAQIDSGAKAAYRRRLEELREEMEEAERLQDDDRLERIQTEIDALVSELSRAIGLGGRDRRAASAAEKARLNVTRAIRAAITRIEQAHPAAGHQLDRAVKTGVFCVYAPDPDAPILWVTQP